MKSLKKRIIALITVTAVFLFTLVTGIYGQRALGELIENTSMLPDSAYEPEDSIILENAEPEQEIIAEIVAEPEPNTEISESEADDFEQSEEEGMIYEIRERTVLNIFEIDPDLSNALDDVAGRFNCVSVSLAVFDGLYDFFTYQYGYAEVSQGRPIDEETKFRVASLAKYTTAILVMSLVENGKLDLDEDISVYLGYEVRNPNYQDVAITSRMLLQHTSTIIDADAYIAARGSLSLNGTRNLLNTRSMFKNRMPGTMFEYSDFGFIVLGAICEKISGQLLNELAREVLFEPLGIDAAYGAINLESRNIAAIYRGQGQSRSVQTQLAQNPGQHGSEHNLAQGSLMINALDYAKILAMLANGGLFDDVRILSEESVEEIHNANINTEFGYSQGLAVRFQENAFMGDDVFWHTGSAYGLFTQFMYCIETKRGIVVITTGIVEERESNGMLIACNAFAELLW